MLFENKNGATNASDLLLWGALIAVILVSAQSLGFNPLGAVTGQDGSGQSGNTLNVKVDASDACNVEDTTYTLKSYNKYTQSTAVNDGNGYSRVFVTNGATRGDSGSFADGVAKTVSPNNVLEIYAAENSSTHFVQKMTKTVPCEGTLDVTALLAPIDTAPSHVYENANGQVNTVQDLAATNVYNYKEKFTSTSDSAVGNPYLAEQCRSGNTNACNRVCYQFNVSVVDKVSAKNMVVANSPYSSQQIAAPRDISNNLTAVGYSINCWTFPSFEDGQEMTYTLEIDTAGSAPKADDTINSSLAYVDYGLNSETNAEIIGVEDNDFATLVANTPLFVTSNPVDIS